MSSGSHADLDPERAGAGLDDGDGLRVAGVGDQEHAALAGGEVPAHAHRLGGGGRLVEQRGVGQRQAGQVGDHRLVVDQRLEPALADLGLIRRVLRVPARVLEDIALDHRRGDAGVIAHADQRAQHLVAADHRAKRGLDLVFAGLAPRDHLGAEAQRLLDADRHRHGAVDQRVDRVDPERGQHRRGLVRARTDVAMNEGVTGCQERCVVGHGDRGENVAATAGPPSTPLARVCALPARSRARPPRRRVASPQSADR